jgi:hypothetical protein
MAGMMQMHPHAKSGISPLLKNIAHPALALEDALNIQTWEATIK